MWYIIIIDAMCEQRTGQEGEPYSPHFEPPWPLQRDQGHRRRGWSSHLIVYPQAAMDWAMDGSGEKGESTVQITTRFCMRTGSFTPRLGV